LTSSGYLNPQSTVNVHFGATGFLTADQQQDALQQGIANDGALVLAANGAMGSATKALMIGKMLTDSKSSNDQLEDDWANDKILTPLHLKCDDCKNP